MKSIGGYLNLEVDDRGTLFHDNALDLNSGRNCLEHILREGDYEHIYVPYYTCDVVLEPIEKLELKYTFYHIDEYFLPILNNLKKREVVLYTNYFGLMSNNIHTLIEKGVELIVDNSQAFYDMPYLETPTFYSPRKFFGVADGGFVYNTKSISSYEYDNSIDRMSHLLKSIDKSKEEAYLDFKRNDDDLIGQPIKKMSKLTNKLLKGIDYDSIREIRIKNFKILHESLRKNNQLTDIIDSSSYSCPMIYPFMPVAHKCLRNDLIKKKIYNAKYWPNVLEWVDKDSLEYRLTENIIHLPIDQRYNELDMKYVLNSINKIQSE